MTVALWTDGGCSPNPGVGGWAAVVRAPDGDYELSGADLETTNNRMELTAVIRGLQSLARESIAVVHSDSLYVVRGGSEWIRSWRKRGWRTKNPGPLLNVDLWKELDLELGRLHVHFRHVPGHTGVELNERAHELAAVAREEIS